MQNYIIFGLIFGYLFNHMLFDDKGFIIFTMLLGALVGAVAYLYNHVIKLQLDVDVLRKKQAHHSVTQKVRVRGTVSQIVQAVPPGLPSQPSTAETTKKPAAELAQTAESTVVHRHQHKPLANIINYLSGGNPLVRIGAVVLFFGMAFLAKYAAEHSVISIETRLVGIGLFAVALIVTGWKLRSRSGQYGVIIQGIGIAMVYLVIYAAAKLYMLLPMEMAFIFMLITVIFGALLALKQASLPLMLFATTGGFLVPILTSSGSGSHIALFGYYTLLNVGIVFVAWYRSWRILNVTGFLFTFVIATVWGVLSYEPSLLNSTEPFLILFFLFYLGITILFTYRQPYRLKGYIDTTLVFGVPLAAFTLQSALIKEIEYALAFSALSMGGLYLFLAKLLWKQNNMRLLSETFIALSIVFVTLAVPYALDGHWTSATWALESSAIIWIGLRQKRYYARVFGMGLQVVSGLLFWYLSHGDRPETAFLNGVFFGSLTIAFAALFTAWLYEHHAALIKSGIEQYSASVFLGLGSLWMLLAGARDVDAYCDIFGNGMLIYIAVASAVLAVISHVTKWKAMRKALQGYFILGVLFFLSLVPHFSHYHPFEGIGLFAFVLFFTVHYLLLYRYESCWRYPSAWHTGAVWILAMIGSWELSWQIAQLSDSTTYQHIARCVIPILLSIVILKGFQFMQWPLRKYANAYKKYSIGGLSLGLLYWEQYAFMLNADPAPFAYFPLFNPLEIMQIIAISVVAYWWFHNYRSFSANEGVQPISIGFFTLFTLFALTITLARSIYFYTDIAYEFHALWDSALFQTALSLLWTAIAFVIILLSRYRGSRFFWIGGATLLGAVITKLFLVDLSNSATLERIISFSAVGVLVLLIGYIAPLPPKKQQVYD